MLVVLVNLKKYFTYLLNNLDLRYEEKMKLSPIYIVNRSLEIIDKHLLTQIRLLYKCACKDIYVKYLVTYLEGTQQTTINPYELIVIPDGKSNSDYTRNLPSVF